MKKKVLIKLLTNVVKYNLYKLEKVIESNIPIHNLYKLENVTESSRTCVKFRDYDKAPSTGSATQKLLQARTFHVFCKVLFPCEQDVLKRENKWS